MARNSGKLNLKKVAKIAGVSHTTVSLVLNNKTNVSEETRKRVLKIVRDSRFVKRTYESKGKKRKIILYIAEKYAQSGGYYSKNLFVATQYALQNAGNLCVLVTNEQFLEDPSHLEKLHSEEYGGVILAGRVDDDVMKRLKDISVPRVGLDFTNDDFMDTSFMKVSVRINNVSMFRQMILKLSETGAKKIAFIGPVSDHISYRERFLGYLSGMMDAQLEIDKKLHWLYEAKGGFKTPDVIELVQKKWKSGNHVDAICCVNDNLAIVVQRAIEELGVSVPDQVQITGFDHFLDAQPFGNQVTTVEYKFEAMAEAAVKALENDGKVTDPYCHFIFGKIISGSSTRF